MRNWDAKVRPKARIEIIPMIDVMMFLLVFFVLISQNVIPAFGLKTKLPEAANTDNVRAEKHRVTITLTADQQMQLEGKPVTLDALPATLTALAASSPEPLLIIINGDQVTTLKTLVGVMDKLKGAGFDAVSIATDKLAPPAGG
jgi:biopolymer transport protein ExbD